jgi:PAS domain S-box-containing protein
LFENATESILVTDEFGCIQLVNSAAEKLFGYTMEEMAGQSVEFLIPKRYTDKHVQHRNNYSHNPHSRKMGMGMDLSAQRKDRSEFPVEVSLSPFKTGNQNFVLAFIVDISNRKKVEDEIKQQQTELEKLTTDLRASNEKLESKVIDRTKVLQEALTQLENSKKELSEALEKEKELNELKSRFLSMASHEFRTPLTAILSSASLIEEYPESDQREKRTRHVNRIKSGVNNLSDFLSISKIEEGKVHADLKNFNLKNLISEIAADLKSIAKPGQQILVTHDGDEETKLDHKLVRNIVINLTSNAIKFSEENKKVYINSEVKNEQVILSVRDEGMGISEEDKKHLFQRFFRGHNATNIQGTGLGLHIVANYVELMSGYIEFESELEKGTLFTITFPVNN